MKASDFFKTENYFNFVMSQVKDMEVDDLNKVDVGSKDFSAFRMNLHNCAKKLNVKFKTKVKNNELFVGRVE